MRRNQPSFVFAIFAAFSLVFSLSAQTSAFTYQGRLDENGTGVSGIYDLQFRLCDAATNGNFLGTQTNATTTVNNGLFTVQLDFGGNVFTGAARWIEVGVRTNGSVSSYNILSPRQMLTSVPYAITANNTSNLLGTLPATQISGFLSVTQLSGTVALAQLPAAVITNNATGVSLTGTFAGNGGGLTNIPGALAWQLPSSTNVQAQRNTGYLLTNDSQVTLTLPTANELSVGDSIRISSAGLGGWKLLQNAGQSVQSKSFVAQAGVSWVGHDANRDWFGVALSADGSKLFGGAVGQQMYASLDGGLTWNPQGPTTANWWSIACSADGNKLVAAIFTTVFSGGVLVSTNAGLSWTGVLATNRPFISAASSADGVKLVVGCNLGGIFTSTDSGATWTRRIDGSWKGLACSADGVKIAAASANGQIFTSTDSGANWTARESSRSWQSLASSADGTKLVAVAYGDYIYTSIDSGVTWTPRDSARNWYAVASSSDGSKLVAAVNNGQIYVSLNSGVTWTPRDANRPWTSVASSSDGNKLVAGTSQAPVYVSAASTISNSTTGMDGWLAGGANSAIELQYLGNGRFTVVSCVGDIVAN